MKMVSSSKLHKAEVLISNMLHYSQSLHHIVNSLLTNNASSPLRQERPVRNVAIIAFSSDTSLCGAYNNNVSSLLQKTIETYKKSLGNDHIFVYTIGKKVFEFTKKTGITVTGNFEKLATKPDYNTIADFASSLISQFEKKQIDRVELIYHHFKNAGTLALEHKQLLPITPLPVQEKQSGLYLDYIFEPSQTKLLQVLVPMSIKHQLYTALLDASASEHAARMIAMQIATDNANELVSKLTIKYNKMRQQSITNELLVIIGGSTQ